MSRSRRGGRHGGKGGSGRGKSDQDMAGKGSGERPSGAKGGTSGRGLKDTGRFKTAKGRSLSSARWLQRQISDPYVAEAKAKGYRSRAAFKLAEMDDRFHLLGRGARVVDLGAAPGGWAQLARERCGAEARVVAVDLVEIEPLEGVITVVGDFREADTQDRAKAALGGRADVVLSDMAAPATGHAQTDHLRIMGLAEAAFEFAADTLAPGGAFVVKVLRGGTEATLLSRLKQAFAKVRHVKPPASRSDSAELYLVATGFRGAQEAQTSGS